MSVVFWKELADHFSSLRFIILLVLIILIGFLAIFTSGQAIRGVADEVPTRFVFLLLLTSQTIFFSPSTLFANAIRIIIDPGSEILERASRGRAEGILPTPLDLGQSLLQIWPHLTTLIAMVVICFGIAYIKFMRDEIRT